MHVIRSLKRHFLKGGGYDFQIETEPLNVKGDNANLETELLAELALTLKADEKGEGDSNLEIEP